jgi:nitrite reductase (NO-forming)
LQTDATAKEMLEKYKIPMPNQNASDAEIDGYVAYFKWADKNLRPQGQTQPQPAAPDTAKGPGQTLSAPGPAYAPPPPAPGAH